MSDTTDKIEAQKASDAKTVNKAVQEMTLGELKDFVKQHGDQIGLEVSRTETFNTKYTAMPRAQIVSPEEKK